MNQDCENGISTKVKIQVRVSDLIKDHGANYGQKTHQQRDESSNGSATNSFEDCQPISVPKIKIDEATVQDLETNNLHPNCFADSKSSAPCSPRPVSLAPENGRDDWRRKSVASSAPASKESFREERPQLRKCLSLRETRQGRSRGMEENKIVRFADIYGLDLLDVKVFKDEMPKVPVSAFQYLGAEGNKFCSDNHQLEPTVVENKLNFGRKEIGVPQIEPTEYCYTFFETQQKYSLVPLFDQPGNSLTFTNIVQSKNICLERVRTDSNACIFGLVRVVNLSYQKLVTVMWTKDDWQTVNEQAASHVVSSSEGGMDQFEFTLKCGAVPSEEMKVELCLKFSCQGDLHWDNNMGRNYIFHATPTNADVI